MKVVIGVLALALVMLGGFTLFMVLTDEPAQTQSQGVDPKVAEGKACKEKALGENDLRTRLNNLLLCANTYKGTVTLEEVTLLNSQILLRATAPPAVSPVSPANPTPTKK